MQLLMNYHWDSSNPFKSCNLSLLAQSLKLYRGHYRWCRVNECKKDPKLQGFSRVQPGPESPLQKHLGMMFLVCSCRCQQSETKGTGKTTQTQKRVTEQRTTFLGRVPGISLSSYTAGLKNTTSAPSSLRRDNFQSHF